MIIKSTCHVGIFVGAKLKFVKTKRGKGKLGKIHWHSINLQINSYNMAWAEFLHGCSIDIDLAFVINSYVVIPSAHTEFITIQRMGVNTVQTHPRPSIFNCDKTRNREDFISSKHPERNMKKMLGSSNACFNLKKNSRWLLTVTNINSHHFPIFSST